MAVAVSQADPLHARDRSRPVRLLLVGTAFTALTATAATIGAGAHDDNPAMNGLLRATMVAAPLGVGLYAWRLTPYTRLARLLVAVGLATFVTTLTETGDATLYSVGRVAGWGLEALLVVLLLAFPSGRLTERRDRRLTAAMVGILAAFYLPTLVLADHFRVPSPYTSCVRDCPPNVFFLLDRPASFVNPLFLGTGSLLVFAVMIAVVLRLQDRIAAAQPLQRQLLVPVLAVGIARVTLVGCAIVGRELGGSGQLASTAAWLIAWATPMIALAFLVGLVRTRLFATQALRRLAGCVRGAPDVPTLQRAFAEALEDPTVAIVFPRRAGGADGWMDRLGHEVVLPPDQAVHLLYDRDGAVTAALICDRELAERPELLDASAALAAVALDNLRLAADAEAAARETRRSRARIAAAADRERRRIERDLHDGAQQRLVALRIELGLVENLVRDDPDRCVARLRSLEGGVGEALDELRSLAHGVCPPLLSDRGLVEALRAVAAQSPLPVMLDTQHVDRYAPEIESAVYFSILEALQNAAKHASGAKRIVVRLDGDVQGELRFSVRDDGAGAPGGELAGGAGVTNMHDRMAAIGGSLRVSTHAGIGTEVRGRVPHPHAVPSTGQL